jgi:hypothetical protein
MIIRLAKMQFGFELDTFPVLIKWNRSRQDGGANLYSLPRQQKTPLCGRDVAPQGRYSKTTVFARGAPQLVNFLEKNNTFLKIE